MRTTTTLKRFDEHSHRIILALMAGAWMLFILSGSARADDSMSPSAILQELRSFNTLGTVLHVGAHPDDENTQLITYLALGRGYRTAYLSVTRGDGGQNLLGSQFFEQLGVARTQELLAARRLDGGRQFFTRAIDFGYSKSPEETLRIWDRRQVLGDVVRIIRTFRPDVIITRFSPQGGGHGHHTASAVLAVEAFKLAGDPAAFPEQLDELSVWQPKRVMVNSGGGGRGRGRGRGGNQPAPDVLRIDVGGIDPVSNESFSSIAGRSRAMHKTQGFGNFGGRGGGGGPSFQSFQLLDGEPATIDIMDGVDTTWARIPGGAEIAPLTAQAIASFNPGDPAASVPALLAIRSRLTALPADRLVNEKREQFDRIIQSCLGLTVQTTIEHAEVVPGESLQLHHTARVRADVPVRWLGVRFPSLQTEEKEPIALRPNEQATRQTTQVLPADMPLSQPYWLRQESDAGIYHVDDPSLIGLPENPPALRIEQIFDVGGQTLVIADEPVQVSTSDATAGGAGRRMDVIAPVSVRFVSDVRLFAPGAERPVEVEITAARAGVSGVLQLSMPNEWMVAPASQRFSLSNVGEPMRFTFTVTAPPRPAVVPIGIIADVQGSRRFTTQRVEIRYDHIPLQVLQPQARLKAVSLELAIRGKSVGYLPGAGDHVAECLEQMGYAVTLLGNEQLSADALKGFDAVVVGIRAFDTRQDLDQHLPALLAYAEGGGNLIFQYNRNGVPRQLGPLTLQISQQRITDETAEMTFLAPDHPALNEPNKITAADFQGWVQERGVYFPSQWQGFTPLLSAADPGEEPLEGGLLVAQHGKGHVVYTGLAFFRQLPEGVPGAYRLFANLVSLGK